MQTAEWLVPEGQYFVMGIIAITAMTVVSGALYLKKNIVGKATYIWMSLEKKRMNGQQVSVLSVSLQQ